MEAVAFNDTQAESLAKLNYQELVRLFGRKTGKCRVCKTPVAKTVLVGTRWGLRRVQIRNVCGWYCIRCCPHPDNTPRGIRHDHFWTEWGAMTGTPGME